VEVFVTFKMVGSFHDLEEFQTFMDVNCNILLTGKAVLKWISKKWEVMVWSGLN